MLFDLHKFIVLLVAGSLRVRDFALEPIDVDLPYFSVWNSHAEDHVLGDSEYAFQVRGSLNLVGEIVQQRMAGDLVMRSGKQAKVRVAK